jgi:beta-lactamase regulating signal transducer with metallopeptidase domain
MENAITGSILILATAILRKALKNRLPAETWLALWAVCLFRLLTPFSLKSRLSIYRLLTAPQNMIAQVSEPGAQALSQMQPSAPLAASTSIPSGQVSLITQTGATSGAPSLSAILGAVYLLVAFLIAFHFLCGWWRTLRAVNRCVHLDPSNPLYAVLPRNAHLREGFMDGAPLTFGVLRPTVVLPPNLSQAELDFVLRHEATHARRRDNLWYYAAAIAIVIHWYNPVVWLLPWLLRQDVESCCDRAVISQLGRDARSGYAQVLVSLSTQAEGSAFCHHFSQNQTKERIVAIMKYKKTAAASVVLALVLVAGVTAAFASAPTSEADEEPMAAVAIGHHEAVSTIDAAAVSNSEVEEVVIDGNIGERFVAGDLIFEIVSPEEVTRMAASQGSSLSGDSMSQAFEVTSACPYAKVWISNSGTGNVRFTMTESTPTGSVVNGSNVTIASGISTIVYSTNKWPAGTYYANFTSGKADLSGDTACRVASSVEELDK